MIERRPDIKFVLLSFDIRHTVYNGINIYYTDKPCRDGFEWHVEVEVPDMTVYDEQWYGLRQIYIHISMDEYVKIGSYHTDEIIIAGLKKAGLL